MLSLQPAKIQKTTFSDDRQHLDDDPVVAGQGPGDLGRVPIRQQFDAHCGIITNILFGSGYAGLGKDRLRR
jgi:hypothetical protein